MTQEMIMRIDWKNLAKYVAFAFALTWATMFIGKKAFAEDVVLDWTNPTEQESCTNAGATTIDGVNIWQLVDTVDSPLETYTISAMKPGSYTYAATAFNADGESRLSGKTEKTVTQWVTTNIVVKIVTTTEAGFFLLGVGTIPLGTPCDPAQEVNGHFAVPKDNIVWSDPARNEGTATLPLLVVAQCG